MDFSHDADSRFSQFKGWAVFLFFMGEFNIKFDVEGLWILV